MRKLIHYKFLFFAILLFVCQTSISQKKWDTKDRYYTGGILLKGLMDVDDAKVLGLEPYGKKVSITYDPYYNKYTIDYIDKNGTTRMVLEFIEENSGGKMYKDSYAVESKYNEYFVHNNIEKEDKFILIGANSAKIEGRNVKLILAFEDLK